MFPKCSWNQVLTVNPFIVYKNYYEISIIQLLKPFFLGIVFTKYSSWRQSDIGQSDIGVLFKQEKTHFETWGFLSLKAD